jgi:hypothetical protein
MKLKAYIVSTELPDLVPADPSRNWMHDFANRHPYRCLPLAIANTYGWELLSPRRFRATWNGGKAPSDITVEALDDKPGINHFVQSHFGGGVLTFHTGYLFRTEPGWNMMATGPVNDPKDGIAALTGVIETDWLPFPFTMNWLFTRPGTVTFEEGEAFCLVYVVQQDIQETVQPEIHGIHSDPDLLKQYEMWREHRSTFLARLGEGDPAAMKEAWQRFYFRGIHPDTGEKVPTHNNKHRTKEPIDMRGK